MILKESLENLKAQINIVDVIGNYLELKKSGSNYITLCPFHEEKTPSFVVSPQKQIFHCFGCHIGGDAIKFVAEYEKISYSQAAEKIATLYNIPLQYSSKKDLKAFEALEIINKFYIKNLFYNKEALNYLLQRGVWENTINKFELGYAPKYSNEQLQFFKKENLDFNILKELGVLTSNGYPFLFDRITFPIFSAYNKIIAFGGRTLGNNSRKYINFPDTKIFNKRYIFYGLNLAKEHIIKQKEIIIVEGYMDVIMMHQGGYKTAVATLGTALTPNHIPTLNKLKNLDINFKVILLYDGDNAGINAAFKASKLLFEHTFNGGVVILPNNLDPADAINNNIPLNEFLASPINFLDFILNTIVSKYDLKDYLQKNLAKEEIENYIKELKNDILKEEVILRASTILNIPPNQFKRYSYKSEEKVLIKKRDIAEASIIKTLFENENLIEEVIEYLPTHIFKTHSKELKALYEYSSYEKKEIEKFPDLMDIVLDESILVLNEENLKKQILSILINYFEEQEKLAIAKKDLLKYKKINSIIQEVKKGNLIYEEI
jgi:DNA primase